MRIPALSTSLLLVGLVSAAPAVAAAAPNQAKFELPTAARLAGVELEAGTYKVEWTGTGADVEVTVRKGSKVLLTTKAKLAELPKPVDHDQAILRQDKDGGYVLRGMQFKGKTGALDLGDAAAIASAKPVESGETARTGK